MINRLKNECIATFNKKQYKMRLTFSAMLEVESMFDDMTVHQILSDIIQNGISSKNIISIITLALQAAGTEHDESELLEDIEHEGINAAAESVVMLISTALNGGKTLQAESKKKAVKKKPVKKKRRTTKT